ncbi:MAG: hypothetical protein JW749_10225 [Sedimentisphaerales bacterium]|nr:hypothetical protein [Sedimentisphaerales bacterium]
MKRLVSAAIIISATAFFAQPVWSDSTKIYWADDGTNKIQRANLDGSNIEDLITTESEEPHIVFDTYTSKIYWTDYITGKIRRADQDGNNIEDLIQGLSSPYGIASDLAGHIYWTSIFDKIQRANVNGNDIEDLVTTAYTNGGIALDTLDGKMYWSGTQLYRANLDGSNIEELTQPDPDVVWLPDVALDVTSGKMYWTHVYNGQILRGNFDGNNVEVLVTDLLSPWNITLDLVNSKMYWTDRYTGKIQRANLDGSFVEDVVTGLSSPCGITIPTIPCINNFEMEPVIGFNSSGAGGGPFTPVSKTYTLHNTGPNNISWTASVTQDWLDVSPSSGILGPNDINAVQININSNAAGLNYGAYSDTLTIANTTCGMDWSRSVNLRVFGPTIKLSQNEFYFEADLDGNNPAKQVLGISNIGGGLLNWQVSETCGWLSVDPNCGSSTSQADDVNIFVDISGLAAGIYNCQLIISSDLAENSPQIATVQLAVRVPIIELSKNAFYFTVPENGDNPTNQVLGISNGGSSVLNWQISETCDWLSVDPNWGSIASEVDNVNIIVDINGLSLGIHTCEILVSSDYAGNSPQIVTIGLIVVMPEFKLTASDGTNEDFFGSVVDINGDRCIVGVPYDNDMGWGSGSAYIFKWNGTSWIQQAKLIEPDANSENHFGCDVGIDGDRCVVGSWHVVDMGYESGFAYIFEWNGTSWVQAAKLKASDSNNGDGFGCTVGLSDNRCAVGAPKGTGNAAYSGAAYIFEWNGAAWIEQAKLTASDGAAWDYFGDGDISIDGDRCIVGAYGDDDKGTRSGSAYIFEWNGTSWIQQAKLTASDGSANDKFGISVDISGDRCIVGNDDYGGGSAYIFEWNGANWIQQAKLTAPDRHSADHFGTSVGINDDRCIVGSWNRYINETYPGAAYIFEWNDANWNEILLIASDGDSFDNFGRSVDISDKCYIVGASSDDDIGENRGSVYVYQPYSLGNLDRNLIVDFYDYAILASQWLQAPGIPSADIAPTGGNGFVDDDDLVVFCQNWLD